MPPDPERRNAPVVGRDARNNDRVGKRIAEQNSWPGGIRPVLPRSAAQKQTFRSFADMARALRGGRP